MSPARGIAGAGAGIFAGGGCPPSIWCSSKGSAARYDDTKPRAHATTDVTARRRSQREGSMARSLAAFYGTVRGAVLSARSMAVCVEVAAPIAPGT